MPRVKGGTHPYFYVLITAWNFMYLVPELGEYLRVNAWNKVQPAIQTYQDIAHHWMTAQNEEPQAENAIMPYQQTHSIFQAKALVLRENQATLSKFLDTPIVPAGDLYYMQNLVAALSAGGTTTSDVTPPARPRLRLR
jgi:hypothetical protein